MNTKTVMNLVAGGAGAMTLAVIISSCTPDKSIGAITLEIKTEWKVAKILTKQSIVKCISWFDNIPIQKGNGVDISDTSSGAISEIKIGDKKIITKTSDESTIMIGNGIDAHGKIAYLHTRDKNMTPKMKIYKEWEEPSSDFCSK